MNRALIETLLPDWPKLAPEARAAAAKAALAFVERELALAPAHVRIGLKALGAAFAAFARIAALGRGFKPLASAKREAILRNWSRLGFPFAAYVRVMRSLAILAFAEHPATLEAMGLESAEEKQTRFRATRAETLA